MLARRFADDSDSSSLDTNSTDMEYDCFSRVTKIKDELDNGTTFTYDNLSRKLSMTNPLSGTTLWTYYCDGSVETMIDPNAVNRKQPFKCLDTPPPAFVAAPAMALVSR